MELPKEEKFKQYIDIFSEFKQRLHKQRSLQDEIQLDKATQFALAAFPKEQSPKLLSQNPKLSNLKLMSIDELNKGQIHKGKFLKLKLLLHCYFEIGIIGLCEDHTKQNCMQIFVIHFDLQDKHYDAYFSPDTVIYVKEPLLQSLRTGPALIIDRKEDIVFQRDTQALELSYKGPKMVDAMLDQYRQVGIKLMNAFRYGEAYELYTKAIQCTMQNKGKIDYMLKFFLNKAIVCDKLHLMKQYKESIQRALMIDGQNVKAIYHSIKILIDFEQYEEAKKLFSRVQDPSNLKKLSEYCQFQKSFKEKKINWFKVFKQKKIGQYTSQAVEIRRDYQEVSVRLIPIASRDIKAGQILLVERPLLYTEYSSKDEELIFSEQVALTKLNESIRSLYALSPQFTKQYLKLIIGQMERNVTPSMNKFMRILKFYEAHQLDQFVRAQVYDVNQQSNKIKRQLGKTSNFSNIYPQSKNKIGLYRIINLMVHSCQSNCQRLSVGDTMIIFAKKPIRYGSYLKVSRFSNPNFAQRKKVLKEQDIECSCKMCRFQIAEVQKYRDQQPSKQIEIITLINKVVKQGDKDALNKLKELEMVSIPVIVALAKHGEIARAADKFRAIFQMSESESLQIITSAIRENMK